MVHRQHKLNLVLNSLACLAVVLDALDRDLAPRPATCARDTTATRQRHVARQHMKAQRVSRHVAKALRHIILSHVPAASRSDDTHSMPHLCRRGQMIQLQVSALQGERENGKWSGHTGNHQSTSVIGGRCSAAVRRHGVWHGSNQDGQLTHKALPICCCCITHNMSVLSLC